MENSRETSLPLPKKEADSWVAWGAGGSLETRNLQITMHRHPDIQANTGLLTSTQNCPPSDKRGDTGASNTDNQVCVTFHRSAGPRHTAGIQWVLGREARAETQAQGQCTFLTKLT